MGFGWFKDFVDSECPFGLRKGQHPVEVYRRFVVDLGVPLGQVRKLEWSNSPRPQ